MPFRGLSTGSSRFLPIVSKQFLFMLPNQVTSDEQEERSKACGAYGALEQAG